MYKNLLMSKVNNTKEYYPFILSEEEMRKFNDLLYENGLIADRKKDVVSFTSDAKIEDVLMLTREFLKDYDNTDIRPLFIPEWENRMAHVRNVSAEVRERFEKKSAAKKYTDAKLQIRAEAAVLSVCDGTGKLTFTKEDAEWLTEKHAGALDRIFDLFCEINHVGMEDVEELEKNSASDRT